MTSAGASARWSGNAPPGRSSRSAIALVVLAAFPSPVRPYLPAAAALRRRRRAGGRCCLARVLPDGGASRWARALRTAAADVRAGLLARRILGGVIVASAVVVAGHLATFLVAARTAGADAPLSRLVPLTLLALLAMGLPLTSPASGRARGWPRGRSAPPASPRPQGVATATVYGALVLVASLPGAAVLLARRHPVAAAQFGSTASPVSRSTMVIASTGQDAAASSTASSGSTGEKRGRARLSSSIAKCSGAIP